MFSKKDDAQKQRLSSGGLIDRSKPISFKFDGKPLMGYDGDTLASALLANDIKLVGRSFKYHRPRGIYTAGTEEPNALVALRNNARTEPNTKATNIELFEGLDDLRSGQRMCVPRSFGWSSPSNQETENL